MVFRVSLSIIIYLRLCESYIILIRKIKKVNALGKISARADDKPGYSVLSVPIIDS